MVELLTAPCICGHFEDRHRWFGGRWLGNCRKCGCSRYEPDEEALEKLRQRLRDAAVPPFNPDIGRVVEDGGEWGTLVRCSECHGHGVLHQLHKQPEIVPTEEVQPMMNPADHTPETEYLVTTTGTNEQGYTVHTQMVLRAADPLDAANMYNGQICTPQSLSVQEWNEEDDTDEPD